MRSGVLWVDVGDLFWWPHDHVTGIQRTMASIIVELIENPPDDLDIRFCAYTPERDFHRVPQERAGLRAGRLLGLLDAEPQVPMADTATTVASAFPAAAATRRFRPVLWLAKVFLRCLPRDLREPTRHFCYAGLHLSRATLRWATGPLRRSPPAESGSEAAAPVGPPGVPASPEVPALLERPAEGDTLLNVGCSWINARYNAFVRREQARCSLRYVAMLYDCNPYSVPQFHLPETVTQFCDWAEDTIGIADRLITISRFSKRDLLRFMRERQLPEKVPTVVRLADAMAPPRRPATARADLAPLFARGGFLLTVSSIAPSKNHGVLVRAVKLLRQRGYSVPPLLWAGVVAQAREVDAILAAAPGLAEGIVRAGVLEEDDLKLAYRHCRFTIFPSRFEGWGLPVAESLQFGKVCLASDTTSIPEVGGPLVDYFDPDDAEALAGLITRYLDDAALAAREAEIASRFRPTTWGQTVREILDAIEPVPLPGPAVH